MRIFVYIHCSGCTLNMADVLQEAGSAYHSLAPEVDQFLRGSCFSFVFSFWCWVSVVVVVYLRDRPFNWKGGGGGGIVFFRSQNFFCMLHAKIILVFMCQDIFFCLQFLTLIYMVKILSQIIFFSASNYLFREKHSPPPLQVNWSVPNLFPGLSLSIDVPSSWSACRLSFLYFHIRKHVLLFC